MLRCHALPHHAQVLNTESPFLVPLEFRHPVVFYCLERFSKEDEQGMAQVEFDALERVKNRLQRNEQRVHFR